MNEYLGGELIVDRLTEFGIRYVFGTCGHGNIGLLDVLRERSADLPMISVHHEAIAGFMAEAYFKATGQPAATLTSCGPGTSNLPIALGSALRDAAALLAITGNVPTEQFDRGPFQELWTHYQADAVSATRPYVKRSFHVTRTEQLSSMLDHALTAMLDGRPGPVQLDVPLNIFREPVPDRARAGHPRTDRRGYAPSPDDVGAFLDLLRTAERPVVVAGELCNEPEAAGMLAELSTRLRIPVATTPAGKGAVAADLELAVGATGRNGAYSANAAVRNADLVVYLGAHVDDRSTSGWIRGATLPAGPARFVQVDVDSDILGRNIPLDLRIFADPAAFLKAVLTAAGDRDVVDRKGWLERIAGWRRRWNDYLEEAPEPPASGAEHPRKVVRELRRVLPDEAIVLADVGVHHNWLVQEWEVRAPRTFLQSWGYASMGFGVGGVLGTALARPDRPSVAIVGDGGMLMFPGAVATAAEYGIPAIWVIWNNRAYASIRDQQLGFFGQDYGTDIGYRQGASTDFALLARAMGAEGLRAGNAAELGEMVRAALSSGRPTVVEISVDRDVTTTGTGAWPLPPLDSPPIAERWHPLTD